MSTAPSNQTKRPWAALGVFTVLALLFSGLIGGLQSAVGIDAELLVLAQFGPALGALVTWLIFRKRFKALMPQAVSRKQTTAHTVLMVAAVVVFAAVTLTLAIATGQDIAGISAVAGAPFVVYLVLQLIGATGEEIGWRGLMQPLLESRMGRLAAASITGVFWASWHVQVFTAGLAVVAAFFVSTIAFAILLGYMGNGSFWQRVLTASIGHWLINVAMHSIAGEQVNELPQVYFTAIAATVTTALFLLMFARAQTTRRRKREQKPADIQ